MTSFTIEPFHPTKHDRRAFSCGIPSVDNYFRMTAGKLARAENIRIYVMVTPSGELVGFYALNAHGVRYEELPERFARGRPSHGYISAGFISMMGRDQRFRGNGYGRLLLADALKRLVQAADVIGTAVIMLDVLDCGDARRVANRKGLYESFGFMPLPSNPLRLYLPIGTVRALIAENP